MNTMTDIKLSQPDFLPMTRKEIEILGWDEIDVLLISGDAYVDHPAFGTALIGRWLVENGYKTGIVSQPDWKNTQSLKVMGRPKLFAGVTSGALDSMLAHYTAFRKKRNNDPYSAGGMAGARPNRACIVYTSLIKQAFKGLPVALGGIEASLRRASHYDFWEDKLRRSILLESKADIIVYGMGERAVLEIAHRIHSGKKQNNPASLQGIPGTVYAPKKTNADSETKNLIKILPSHEDILSDPQKLMGATLALESQVNTGSGTLIQESGGRKVVIEQPAKPLLEKEIDALYALPFKREPHPLYKNSVPALDMIKWSVTSHRGCGGGCAFCSLSLHQGRTIQSRSEKSILDEIKSISKMNDFRGSISDIGGPTANMWGSKCSADPSGCKRKSCLTPKICKNFKDGQDSLRLMLIRAKDIDSIKHIRVASGIRHDLALHNKKYLDILVSDFTGGQLKTAPEHITDDVLKLMRKPTFSVFEKFMDKFSELSKKSNKRQYLVSYFISAFPGTTEKDMEKLSNWLNKQNWKPQQIQCFIPTPATVASAMYYTRTDTKGRKIHVAKTDRERLIQHHILGDKLKKPIKK
jgi:uncharacterized radical SAM protein YgiQ